MKGNYFVKSWNVNSKPIVTLWRGFEKSGCSKAALVWWSVLEKPYRNTTVKIYSRLNEIFKQSTNSCKPFLEQVSKSLDLIFGKLWAIRYQCSKKHFIKKYGCKTVCIQSLETSTALAFCRCCSLSLPITHHWFTLWFLG